MISARRRLLLPFLPALVSAQRRRPNVLLITVDDLNTDLGCYGHPLVRTPNIDALARRGIRFDRAYCQYPVCNPSRTSFLSGRYPESTKVLDNRVHPQEAVKTPFLPAYLRRNGYFTARVGKIYHDGMDGAADWDVSLDPRPDRNGPGTLGEGRNLTGGKFAFFRWQAADGTDEDQPDGLIAKEAAALLAKPQTKPWFVAVGLRKPHDPYVAPKKYFEHYPLEMIRPPEHPADDENAIPPAAYPPVRHNLGTLEGREFRRAYYACTSFMDAQLGKVIGALEASGQADNTVIIFFGDHGLHLGEHGWWNKVTLFERASRVPMIVVPPNSRQAGLVCRRPVELLSLFPTVADLAGITLPPNLHGASIRPLLDNVEAQWSRPAYTVVLRGPNKLGRCLHTERFRYAEWDEGRDGVELYDHHSDPNEYHNLARSPAYQPTVASLRAQLQRLQKAAG